MKEDSMLMCLIAFVLGYLVARMMRGNGLMVGGQAKKCTSHACDEVLKTPDGIKCDYCNNLTNELCEEDINKQYSSCYLKPK